MIKIEMLRCFSAVARSGNLADAAARLGRTQSAVSMTLKQLEDAFPEARDDIAGDVIRSITLFVDNGAMRLEPAL